MKSWISQKYRVIFEYEFRRGTNAAQTARNINDIMFSDKVVNECTVRRWFEKFRSGDFNLENESRGDLRSRWIMMSRKWTTRELATRFDVSIPTILNHLK